MKSTWVAATAVAVALGGCGDDPGRPEDRAVGLEAPDSVVVDAVRETVPLSAELVFESGRREPAEGVVWSGCGGDVASLSSEGVLFTVGAGTCDASASWGELAAVVPVTVRPEGVLTITFDDGWKSARTVGLPVLSEAGLVGNVAVVPGTATWPGFLSTRDMRELHDAGWSFVSHTMSHDSLPSLTAEDLVWEITQPIHWLEQQGLRAADVLVVPYHEWGERERAAVQEHFAAARGRTVDYFWPAFMAEWRPEDPYTLTAVDGSAHAGTADGRQLVMEYVERALSEGLFLDIQFHDIPPEAEAGFRALIQALAPYADRVRTWSELYPLED